MLNRWDVLVFSLSFPELRSSISLRRIKQLFTASFVPLIFILLLSPTAYAASFDCAKATTEVEKMICSDSEISKLDEELSIAYNNTLKYAKDSESIRDSQREWIKERNACSDISCIKRAYEKRIAELNKDKLLVSKKYPPYPDVWDWQIPEVDIPSNPNATIMVDLKKMDNGEVIVVSQIYYGGKVDMKYVAFFGEDQVTKPKIPRGTESESNRIQLNNGKYISGGGAGSRSGRCRDALGFSIMLEDHKESTMLSHKLLLYIFDKPEYYETKYPRCMDGPGFYYNVEAVNPRFLALDDGTFLLVANEGHVIRFDENFETKSKLINNKFFWMDMEEFWTFEAKYGDRAVGDKDLKSLYTDLYELLMTKKRRAK